MSGDAFDVTVVVPAFESARWIEATLASIRAQTLSPREILVVDNGSSDDTAARAVRAGATVLVVPGGGPSRARNAGIRAARTSWVAFCDADDLWEPNKLARDRDAARLCPDAVLTVSDWQPFDERGERRDPGMCNSDGYSLVGRVQIGTGIVRLDGETVGTGMYESMFVLTSAAVARRDALFAVGLFDERLFVAEDNDLFLRLLAHGPAVAIEERLVHYRRHPASISADEVVNDASHRLLWQGMEAQPSRYPPGSRAFLRRERVRRSRIAGIFAARRGRFSEARRYLAESLALRFSGRAAAWYAMSVACDNPLARWASRLGQRTKGPLLSNGGLAPGAAARSYDEEARRFPTMS